MSVRAKFTVNSIEMFSGNYGKVKLTAVHDTSTPENERFTKASPSGTLEMAIDNPPALNQFKPGQQFYVDFTPIEQ